MAEEQNALEGENTEVEDLVVEEQAMPQEGALAEEFADIEPRAEQDTAAAPA
jgi:hypothetical protein